MRIVVLVLFLLSPILTTYGQRYAQSNGDWTSVTWTSDKAGTLPAAAPTSSDDVFTNGRTINITGTSVTVRNLAVSSGTSGSLNWTGGGTLTVRGALVGWDDANDSPSAPSTTVITGTGPRITLTAADLSNIGSFLLFNDEIIAYWNENGAIANLTIALSNNATLDADLGADIRVTNQLQITGSGRTLTTGFNIAGIQVVNAFVLGVGVTFDTTVPIRSTTLSTSRVTNFGISGTLITSNFANCTNFNLTATGVLRTSFNGADQTQGWWYQSTNPTGGTTNASSSIVFEADADQNIPARTYGSLTLDASSSVTKTLASGTLNVTGNLTINSASVNFNSNAATSINIGGNLLSEGVWSPSDPVTFNGTAAQSISGSGSLTFSGGLLVSKASGTLTLNKDLSVATALTVTAGTLDLGSNIITLASGNLSNSGTLIASSSNLIISGATAITGSSSTTLNNVSVSGSGSFSPAGTTTILGNISNSGTLTAPASATLTIGGNFANSGTFNANSGTLLFNGTVDQTISGTLSVNNITINNGGATGVEVTGTVNLNGVLSLTGGRFDADGFPTGSQGSGVLVVRSSDIGSGGRIGTMTTPTNFFGNVTIERYIDSPEDYRYLASPITNGNLSMWIDDFGITGSFSDATTPAQNPNVVSSTAPSVFTFNATTQQYAAVSAATTSAASLSNTAGYVAWGYNSSDFVIDMRGLIGKGNINIPTVAGQYNLVPNPYPSAIDWDGITTTGYNNSMFMTTAQGAFATYTKGGGFGVGHPDSNWSGQIALGQSFWVLSTSGTSLPLTESSKVATYEFVREEEPINFFRVKLLSSTNQSDELGIAFRDGATLGTDDEFDGLKRQNPAGMLSFSSYTSDLATDYAINILPQIQCSQLVKFKYSDLASGSYTIRFSDLDKMQLGYTLRLKDNFLGKEKIVSDLTDYVFEVTSDPASKSNTRFELLIASPDVLTIQSSAIDVSADCTSAYVSMKVANTQLGINYQFFLGDKSVSNIIQGSGDNIEIQIGKSEFSAGINNLTLKAITLDGCQSKSFDNIVSYEFVGTASVTSIPNVSLCGADKATLTINGSSEATSFKIYNSLTSTTPVAESSAKIWVSPVLTESVRYYVSAVNKNGCESELRYAVDVSIVTIPKPEITITGETLVSSSASNNQWYKDGLLISGATGVSLNVKETGVYTVKVTSGDCSAVSDNITMTITSIEDSVEGINIYPNPVVESLNVDLSSDDLNQLVSIYITDVTGRVHLFLSKPELKSKNELNVSNLTSGLYILRIQGISKQQTFKVLKK